MVENIIEAVENEIKKWEAVKAKYGNFEYIDDPSEVIGIDRKRIWTEFWTQNQFITNVFEEVDEFDGNISAYYLFERAYEEPESTVKLVTTFWEDCECEGDADCEDCEGEGTIATDVIQRGGCADDHER